MRHGLRPKSGRRFARRQVRTAEAVIRRYPASAPHLPRIGADLKPPGPTRSLRASEGLARVDRLRRETGRSIASRDRGTPVSWRPRSRVPGVPRQRGAATASAAGGPARPRAIVCASIMLPVAAHRSGHQREAVLVVDSAGISVGPQLARRERSDARAPA